MGLAPKIWRKRSGMKLAEVARQCGIGGRNPARTYERYESGAQDCPPMVIAGVRKLSDGTVGADDWLAVRLAHLKPARRSRVRRAA